MKYKTSPAAFKLAPIQTDDGGDREFEAIVSVFNNKDLGGDIVRPGAYKDTLAAWQQAGDPISTLWSHRMDDPEYNIGYLKDVDEVAPGDARIPLHANKWVQENGGLWVRGCLDVDNNVTAAQTWNLLHKRRVTQFSFAYDVLDERPGQDGSNELLKLWLYEVSITPIGMNPMTELIGAKSDAPAEPEVPPVPTPPSAADFRMRCDLAALRHAYAAD